MNLLQDNKRDFRIIPFGFVILYVLILLISEFHLGSYAVIAKYFKIYPVPYFVDLNILLCGIDAIRINLNPYTVGCIDGIPYFNYPIIWGVGSFLPFLTTPNLIYIGFGLALTLFSTLYFYIGKINLFSAIVYTLLFLSPAIMLGVERGNSDLIIFLLLLIPIFYNKSNNLIAFVILVTGMLKLFPIGALLSILTSEIHKRKKSFFLFIGVIVLFLIYLVLMKENIVLVSQKTPRPFSDACYGLGSIPSMLVDHFKAFKIFFFSFYSILIIIVFVLFYYYSNKKNKIPIIDTNRIGISFIIGSGIFITTCLIGYNWEYRLVFLLLTIPQILRWLVEKNLMAIGLLSLTILIVWQSFIKWALLSMSINYLYAQIIIQSFVILLFYCHLTVLINYLISYYKKPS